MPVKYFFLLPEVPESVMWPSYPPIFLERSRLYSVLAAPESQDSEDEKQRTDLEIGVLVFAEMMVTTIESQPCDP